ncbi:MAG: hypothetical protein ACMUFK_04135 [Thermoplasmatota archaeon]
MVLMENETVNEVLHGLDDFFEQFRETVKGRMADEYLEIFKEDRISYIEERLFDQVTVYMGDKSIERNGKKEDVMDMAILAFLIWLRKRS